MLVTIETAILSDDQAAISPMSVHVRPDPRARRNAGAGLAVLAMLALAGCSFTNDALAPSLGVSSGSSSSATPIAPSAAEANPQPTLDPNQPAMGSSTFVSPGVTASRSTGTAVGQKVEQMRADLSSLQGNISQRNSQLTALRQSISQTSQRYHGTVAAIATRLQIGTTPANPVLVEQWRGIQGSLDQLAQDINSLNALANQTAQDSATASFILDSARATYVLPGAIDEDHRQLRVLEDETNRTVVNIDRLLTELSADVARQTDYIGSERANLTVLAAAVNSGQLYGPNLSTGRAFAGLAGANSPMAVAAPQTPVSVEGRQPLVVIRFDRADVAYQQALYNAVSRALERKPDARFDLVSVTAVQGSQTQTALNTSASRRNAERVLRSLTDMGLPANRVTVSATNNPRVASNEVHLYVR